MKKSYSRRQMLRTMSAASAGLLVSQNVRALGFDAKEIEIQVSSVSAHTVRLSVLPVEHGKVGTIPNDGSLVRSSWGFPARKLRNGAHSESIRAGEVLVNVSRDPLAFVISTSKGEAIQRISVDEQKGTVSFTTGDSPLLGLGEGGPQFDRRGAVDVMRSGQGGYYLATHGGRVPVPWIIGTSGWALFFHQPYGSFDFTSAESKFQPFGDPLPLDIFVVAARDPKTILGE